LTAIPDPFAARDTLTVGDANYVVYRLDALGADLSRLPVTVKVLLENVLRNLGRGFVTEADVNALIHWKPNSGEAIEVPFMPGRVVLQDFTGVPCVVDLAAMRDAVTEMGGDPSRINPLVPATWSSTTRSRSTSSGTTRPLRERRDRVRAQRRALCAPALGTAGIR